MYGTYPIELGGGCDCGLKVCKGICNGGGYRGGEYM